MDLIERTNTLLNCLKYCDEKYASFSGIKISKIRDIFLKACDIFIFDSDIKYLFEEMYIKYSGLLPGMDAYTYIHGLNSKIKITPKGIDYLRREKEISEIPLQIIELIQKEILD